MTASSINWLTQPDLDALGEGWEDHTPVTGRDIDAAEARRLHEILAHDATQRVTVNGRDYEGILCLEIVTTPEFGYDLYCLYRSGRIALHDVNVPKDYPTFAAFVEDRA
jgi:hypothetical protein